MNVFFDCLFLVENVENSSNFLFEIVEVREYVVFILFVVEIFSQIRFESTLRSFFKKNENEQDLLAVDYLIENKVHVDLCKSIVQFVTIFMINVKFVDFNSVVIEDDKTSLNCCKFWETRNNWIALIWYRHFEECSKCYKCYFHKNNSIHELILM